MPMLQVDILDLPTSPLDAAGAFYAEHLPEIRDDLDALSEHDLVIVFEPADHEHRNWRRAATQALALEFAPRRVNSIAVAGEESLNAMLSYLVDAPGITGQYLLGHD